MIKLPDITLICVDCINVQRAINVLEKCKYLCEFGDVKLLTSLETDYQHTVKIMPLNTLVAYSVFMVKECHKYFNTKHVLIVQRDGWILNVSAWNNHWLSYDYIAPLFIQEDRVGAGGFSLRSKNIMQEMSRRFPEWNGTQEHAEIIQAGIGCYEDGVLSNMKGFNIAPKDQAKFFAQGGNPNPNYYHPYPFGFHGAWQNVDFKTGYVHPVCEHKGGCGCVEGVNQYFMSLQE